MKLQRGDETNLAIWREMIALSQVQFDTIYQRLGVKFDHTLGESFYNPHLQRVVDELCGKGIARESEGALAVFFEDVPALKEQPALIRKSDGGFNYTTTDLATWNTGSIPGSPTKLFTSPMGVSSFIFNSSSPLSASGTLTRRSSWLTSGSARSLETMESPSRRVPVKR